MALRSTLKSSGRMDVFLFFLEDELDRHLLAIVSMY
jgi:hypothetical protein